MAKRKLVHFVYYTRCLKRKFTFKTFFKRKVLALLKKCLLYIEVHFLGIYFLEITSSKCKPLRSRHSFSRALKLPMTARQVVSVMAAIS